MKKFAVLGMGRFGRSVALALTDAGADVLIADVNEEIISKMSSSVKVATIVDLTDENAIKALDLGDMDGVVVATAHSLEASIMCVMVAKECGVKNITAKAGSHRMGDILKRVGADKIIFPEEESGIRTAKKLISSNFLEYYDYSDELCIIETEPRKEWLGKSLSELQLRAKYSANVIAVKEQGSIKKTIDPKAPLQEGCTLIIVMNKKDAKKL